MRQSTYTKTLTETGSHGTATAEIIVRMRCDGLGNHRITLKITNGGSTDTIEDHTTRSENQILELSKICIARASGLIKKLVNTPPEKSFAEQMEELFNA